jgi:hypothetical protein
VGAAKVFHRRHFSHAHLDFQKIIKRDHFYSALPSSLPRSAWEQKRDALRRVNRIRRGATLLVWASECQAKA